MLEFLRSQQSLFLLGVEVQKTHDLGVMARNGSVFSIFTNSAVFFRLTSNEITFSFHLCGNFLMYEEIVFAFLKAFSLKPFSFCFLS